MESQLQAHTFKIAYATFRNCFLACCRFIPARMIATVLTAPPAWTFTGNFPGNGQPKGISAELMFLDSTLPYLRVHGTTSDTEQSAVIFHGLELLELPCNTTTDCSVSESVTSICSSGDSCLHRSYSHAAPPSISQWLYMSRQTTFLAAGRSDDCTSQLSIVQSTLESD